MREIQSLVCFLYLLIKSAEKVNKLLTRQTCTHLAYKMGLPRCIRYFHFFCFFFVFVYVCSVYWCGCVRVRFSNSKNFPTTWDTVVYFPHVINFPGSVFFSFLQLKLHFVFLSISQGRPQQQRLFFLYIFVTSLLFQPQLF